MTRNISNLFGPVTKPTELFIKSQPLVLSLIILYQGLFAANAIEIPFSATKDIEYALISTVIFLTVMYALKTPKERKKSGFI